MFMKERFAATNPKAMMSAASHAVRLPIRPFMRSLLASNKILEYPSVDDTAYDICQGIFGRSLPRLNSVPIQIPGPAVARFSLSTCILRQLFATLSTFYNADYLELSGTGACSGALRSRAVGHG